LTVSFYLLTIFFIVRSYINNTLLKAFLVGLSFATLFGQPSNVSIALFQSALLLLFFYTIAEYYQKPTARYLTISIVVLCMAILTRFDSIIYASLYFPVGLLQWRGDRLNRKTVIEVALGIVISVVLYTVIFKYLNITIANYYQHNVDFNQWYKPSYSLRLIHRPIHLSLLMVSGLFPTVLIIMNRILFNHEKGIGISGIRNALDNDA